MNQTITYTEAVQKISHIEKQSDTLSKLNAFDRSLILAVLFECDKFQTMNDVLNERMR